MSCPSLRKTLLVVVVAGLALAGPATASATRIVIPRIGLDTPLAMHVDQGPWLYYRDLDTLAVAAHRTTHGHPFLQLPTLQYGDLVTVVERGGCDEERDDDTFLILHPRREVDHDFVGLSRQISSLQLGARWWLERMWASSSLTLRRAAA